LGFTHEPEQFGGADNPPEFSLNRQLRFPKQPTYLVPKANSVYHERICTLIQESERTVKKPRLLTGEITQSPTSVTAVVDSGKPDDGTKRILDLDGYLHSSTVKEKLGTRMAEFYSIFRLAAESFWPLFTGPDLGPFNIAKTINKYEEKYAIVDAMLPTDPFLTVGLLKNLRTTPFFVDHDKLKRFMQFRFTRLSPYELSIYDFLRGKYSSIYPPSEMMCDTEFVDALVAMFSGLQEALQAFFGSCYRCCL
jgi:hypothetical protein